MIIKFRVCHNPDSSFLKYDDWIYISIVCVSPNHQSHMSNTDKGKHSKVALRLFCQDNILVLRVCQYTLILLQKFDEHGFSSLN